MSTNNGTEYFSTSTPSSTVVTLDFITNQILGQLPLVFTIIGFIGFIGDMFTFLQPALRSNPCCIYTLSGSIVDIINLFVNLLPNHPIFLTTNINAWVFNSRLCKLKIFVLVFLPQLSMDLLIMALIDRFASSCGPTPFIRHIHKLKTVPLLIIVTIVISALLSLYGSILHDVLPGIGCFSTQPILNSILYISIHGIMTPALMLILVLLTYRNVQHSRQRVGLTTQNNISHSRNKFIGMIFAQAFVTCFFALQWICFYIYVMTTLYENKNEERLAIDSLATRLTNNLYYVINVKSFYLCTLTSRLFRKTLRAGLWRLVPGHHNRQHNEGRTHISHTTMKRSRLPTQIKSGF